MSRRRHSRPSRKRPNRRTKFKDPEKFRFFLYRYPTYKEIQCYMRMLARKLPKRVKLQHIGRTIRGRDIDMVIIASNFKAKKNAVLIDAGIHGREWLAVTSALCIMDHLVRTPKLLSCMDFYIVPCLNPDGYEYSHTNSRMWRKNLNSNKSTSIKRYGVDLNRNFPHSFGDSKGSSGNPESMKYRGEYPLSELESQALARTFKRLGKQIKLYISFHTYGSLIMFPWGCKRDQVNDRDDLYRCGCVCQNAMTKCGINRNFKVGSIASRMYITSGCTVDYARASHGIKYAFTIELPKGGSTGFNPKPRKILEIGSEVVCGIGAMVRHVHNFYEMLESRRAHCTRGHVPNKLI